MGAQLRLLITDLTEMHGGNFCVAGWDLQRKKMVRPLPNGANWTGPLLQKHTVAPGAVLDVQPTGQAHQSVYPHLTEDTPIDTQGIQLVSRGPTNWFGPNSPAVSADLSRAFGGTLQHNSQWNGVLQGIYVQVGTAVNSLDAIVIPRGNITFVEEFSKLRAVVNDGRHDYKLSVSSVRLKSAWQQKGIAGAMASLPQAPNFHVRVGLARAFGNPPKCYAMLNGVHG